MLFSKHGTQNFTSPTAAKRYYGSAAIVKQKMMDGEIAMGVPELQPTQKAYWSIVEGRYSIETPACGIPATGESLRSDDGESRIAYRPFSNKSKPFCVYFNGTATLAYADFRDALANLESKGLTFNNGQVWK